MSAQGMMTRPTVSSGFFGDECNKLQTGRPLPPARSRRESAASDRRPIRPRRAKAHRDGFASRQHVYGPFARCGRIGRGSSRLIHVGYALVAMVALFAAYCILSPKSAGHGRPGHHALGRHSASDAGRDSGREAWCRTVFRGEPVEISAETAGALRRRTGADFLHDRRPPGGRSPGDNASGPHGYRPWPGCRPTRTGRKIHAACGRTSNIGSKRATRSRRRYQLHTEIAPTIAIESIDLDFPAYTGRPGNIWNTPETFMRSRGPA